MAQPAFYSRGNNDSFPWGKVVRAWFYHSFPSSTKVSNQWSYKKMHATSDRIVKWSEIWTQDLPNNEAWMLYYMMVKWSASSSSCLYPEVWTSHNTAQAIDLTVWIKQQLLSVHKLTAAHRHFCKDGWPNKVALLKARHLQTAAIKDTPRSFINARLH